MLPGDVFFGDMRAHENRSLLDEFGIIHRGVNWRTQLIHGEKIGMGSREYKLISIR